MEARTLLMAPRYRPSSTTVPIRLTLTATPMATPAILNNPAQPLAMLALNSQLWAIPTLKQLLAIQGTCLGGSFPPLWPRPLRLLTPTCMQHMEGCIRLYPVLLTRAISSKRMHNQPRDTTCPLLPHPPQPHSLRPLHPPHNHHHLHPHNRQGNDIHCRS